MDRDKTGRHQTSVDAKSREPWYQARCGATQYGSLFVGCELGGVSDVPAGADGEVSAEI